MFGRTYISDGVLVVECCGSIDTTNTACFFEWLKKIVDEEIEGGCKLLFDFEGVDSMSSAALGSFASIVRELYARDVSVCVLIGSEELGRLFRITRLNKMLPVVSSRDEARRRLGVE